MPIHIDRVQTELEIMRSPDSGVVPGSPAGLNVSSGADESLGAVRGRNALRERLRPIVMEIITDELNRRKRKVGAP
jgi:hypothetical protein